MTWGDNSTCMTPQTYEGLQVSCYMLGTFSYACLEVNIVHVELHS